MAAIEASGEFVFRANEKDRMGRGRRRRLCERERVPGSLLRRKVWSASQVERVLGLARSLGGGIVFSNDDVHALSESRSKFRWLQMAFLKRHYAAIQRTLPYGTVFERIQLGEEAMAGFVSKYEENGGSLPFMTWHGTKETNYESIFKKGLLIGGTDPDVPVSHGASYGHGVYSAECSNWSHSLGYTTNKDSLLLCGVVDVTGGRKKQLRSSMQDVQKKWLWGKSGRLHRYRPPPRRSPPVNKNLGHNAWRRYETAKLLYRFYSQFVVVYDNFLIAPLYLVHLTDVKLKLPLRRLLKYQRSEVRSGVKDVWLDRKVKMVEGRDCCDDDDDKDDDDDDDNDRKDDLHDVVENKSRRQEEMRRLGKQKTQRERRDRKQRRDEIVKENSVDHHETKAKKAKTEDNVTSGNNNDGDGLQAAAAAEIITSMKSTSAILWMPPHSAVCDIPSPVAKRFVRVKREYERKVRRIERSAERNLKLQTSLTDNFRTCGEVACSAVGNRSGLRSPSYREQRSEESYSSCRSPTNNNNNNNNKVVNLTTLPSSPRVGWTDKNDKLLPLPRHDDNDSSAASGGNHHKNPSLMHEEWPRLCDVVSVCAV